MKNPSLYIEAAGVLLSSKERLNALSFGQDWIEPLLDSCAIVMLRQNLGPNRPPMIGFIGCTGTGKSTLFNSLLGQNVSSTSWHAHNTGGPVLAADESFRKAVEITQTQLFPGLTHKTVDPSKQNADQPVTGSPTELICSYDSKTGNVVYIDLPDINTTKSRDDNQVSLRLLPWLDTTVFLTDDETVYHRDYEEPVALAEELKQHRICVLVNRGRDKVDLAHHDLQSVRDFFQVEKIFTLPDLNGKTEYSREVEFVALKKHLQQPVRQKDTEPVLKQVALHSSNLLKENRNRLDMLAELTNNLQATIDQCLSKPVKIPMDKILQDEVLHVLHHLGLRRFAVSNVLHFLKSVMTTGSLFKSFHLAFGDNRNSLLENMLQFDGDKLTHEIAVRLADFGEEIDKTIRQSAHAAKLLKTAPAFRALSDALTHIEESQPFRDSVLKVLHTFEEECCGLLQSDKITSSVKNDPLTAVSVITMLIIDYSTIPGFGSFLLAPSAMSFLPMSKFDSAKRKFQRAVRDLMQTQLLNVKNEFIQQKTQFTLEPSERAWKALQTCAQLKEK